LYLNWLQVETFVSKYGTSVKIEPQGMMLLCCESFEFLTKTINIMKNLRVLTFVLISLFMVASVADAQPWKKLKEKAEKTIGKKDKKKPTQKSTPK
jgi:hypothetical protein